jgi:hypothetical protein
MLCSRVGAYRKSEQVNMNSHKEKDTVDILLAEDGSQYARAAFDRVGELPCSLRNATNL